MGRSRKTQRPLGAVLVDHGVVTEDEVDEALAIQLETNKPLGEILVERALIVRASLARALAVQGGVSLTEEGGFGSGLRARIEHRHLTRRGFPSDGAGETEKARGEGESESSDPPAHPVGTLLTTHAPLP